MMKKPFGDQSHHAGRRYSMKVSKKLAQEDTSVALQKASDIKKQKTGLTMTGQHPDLVTLEPEKLDAIGQTR